MADDKLRSVLVYRVSAELGSSSVLLLANYDFSSDYEAHDGAATDGALYDGRGKGYSEAVGMVVSKDPPRGGGEVGTLGGFKVVQSDTHQVVYGGDSDGLCKCENSESYIAPRKQTFTYSLYVLCQCSFQALQLYLDYVIQPV